MVLRDKCLFSEGLGRAWLSEQSGTSTNASRLPQSWRIREEPMGTERNRGGSLESIRNMFKGTPAGSREVNSRHYSKERVVRLKHRHYGRVGIGWPGQRSKVGHFKSVHWCWTHILEGSFQFQTVVSMWYLNGCLGQSVEAHVLYFAMCQPWMILASDLSMCQLAQGLVVSRTESSDQSII